MKKVLIPILTDSNGGAEQLLQLIGKEFALRRYEVTVFCFLDTKSNFWDEVGFEVIKARNIGLGLVLFIKLLIYNRWEIVFSSQTHINGTLSVLRRCFLLKTSLLYIRESTMVYTRFSGFKLLFYSLFHRAYKWADYTVFQSVEMRNDFTSNVNEKWMSKALVVYRNPIDLLMLDRKSLQYKLSFGEKYIVGMGRLIKEKGFDDLILAFQRIVKQMPGLRLVIIGEGYMLTDLKDLVEYLGIKEIVDFKGYIANPHPYLLHAECCVVSSLIEGFPNVLLQMLALNRRVVSTDCAGGLRGIPNLRLVPPKDVEGLAENVINLLKVNNSEIESDYEMTRQYLAEFSVEKYVTRMLHT